MSNNEIIYEKYKNARDSAWRTLIDFKIDRLPVSVSSIVKKTGIKIDKYSKDEFPDVITYCGLEDIAIQNRAFTIYTDEYTIFYNTDTPEEELRFFIAHELGHYLLKHSMDRKKAGYFSAYYTPWNQDTQTTVSNENDANTFAARLLAPACILKEISVTGREDIAHVCGLPIAEAGIRAKRLEKLMERNSFMLSGLEKQVMKQFDGFVSEYKQTNR